MKSSTECKPNCASMCRDIYIFFFYKVACMRNEQGNLETFLQELSSEEYIL